MHQPRGHALQHFEQHVVAVAQGFHLARDAGHGAFEQRFDQRGAVGEIAVQRGAPDLCLFHHQVQRCGNAMLAEHRIGGIQDEGAAGSRIGTLTLHGLFSDRNVRNGSRGRR